MKLNFKNIFIPLLMSNFNYVCVNYLIFQETIAENKIKARAWDDLTLEAAGVYYYYASRCEKVLQNRVMIIYII